MMNTTSIYQFVDATLEQMKAADMMQLPIRDLAWEMLDTESQPMEGFITWKPVAGAVTDLDIAEVEKAVGFRLPESYKAFLKYKHFYELYSPEAEEVRFFPHPIHSWKEELIRNYTTGLNKDRLLPNGYLPFADHYDWGALCFDTNYASDNNEYPVVLIEFEKVDIDPVPAAPFNAHFIEMIESRLLKT